MIHRKPTPVPDDCITIEVELSPPEIVALLGPATMWRVDYNDPRVKAIRSTWPRPRYVPGVRLYGEISEQELRLTSITNNVGWLPFVSGRMEPVEGGTRITLSCVDRNYLTQLRWMVIALSSPIYLVITICYALGKFRFPPTFWGAFWTLLFLVIPFAAIRLIEWCADRQVLRLAGFLKKNLIQKNLTSKRWIRHNFL